MQHMPLQTDKLSPFVGQKSAKKPTIIQPVVNKKANKDVKPIKFLQWDEETKQIKLCMDLKKFNYLFRTGPAAFIIYIVKKQDNNYLQKLNTDKNLPLIDTTLSKGIYIWNHVIYNEHKNIQIYQLQCLLGEQYKEKGLKRQSLNMVDNSNVFIHGDTVLMAIAAILASEIVFIINNAEDEILENFYTIMSVQEQPFFKLSVINLINNQSTSMDQFKWYNILDNIKFTVIEEQNYISQSGVILAESVAEIMHTWQQEIEMTLEKKLYQIYEIDFLTFFSIAEIITKNSIQDIEKLTTLDNIYHKAIQKQIKYEKDYIEGQYYREIREYCSTSEQISVESLAFKLNQLREQALSLYFLQLTQFTEYPDYQKYKGQIEDKIEEMEQDCIRFNFEVLNIEITQQFDKIEKKFKDGFPENYSSFLAEILKFGEYRGIKYDNLKKHIQIVYASKVYTFLTEYDRKEKVMFEKRMQTQTEKQCSLLKQRDKELTRGMEILQNYSDLMKDEITTLQNLIDFNNQINVVVQYQYQIKRLDEEIKTLKWRADQLQAQKKQL